MNKDTRIASAQFPFWVRRRAREYFLRGMSLRQVQAALEKGPESSELREMAEATGMELEESTKIEPVSVPLSVLQYWCRKHGWDAARKSVDVHLEKRQLERVRRDMSRAFARQGQMLDTAERFLMPYFYDRVVAEDGTATMVPRDPSTWPMRDPGQAISLLMALSDRQLARLKFLFEGLGESLPKLDIGDDLVVVSPEPNNDSEDSE